MDGDGRAVSNGIAPPPFQLPAPDSPDVITANMTRLTDLTVNDRQRFLFKNLVSHLHSFVRETGLTTKEWEETILFLTRTGQKCTPIRQEFILLSDVLGVSALVDAINNPPENGATESSVLGPFFTDDAPELANGESIASEGKGEYMYVEGRILSVDGTPIPNAAIETWETDANGFYDTQYEGRERADCRGRLHSDKDGYFGYRAVVPVAYPIPGDGPVGELLLRMSRHNMRPNHLHIMVEAPGFRKLVTAFYPEGDTYIESDAVFGVKKSLVVTLETVKDEAEARKRGFPKGDNFKLLRRDVILVPQS
ncbi:hypothetical protein GSI_03840 [Ganoderma sinense ZZ0214-1]|uniref:Intradiol ring-cleavage dioxygenases domain-containing protein n=1 Tax=Ganoderma sinense ZZ0214-1 TaxID=1077348 RepID=A0A2G8SK36_9APHY|nr:hypothetical protein GSI_03840 [Ganoderma sinense ZZ0214-1]